MMRVLTIAVVLGVSSTALAGNTATEPVPRDQRGWLNRHETIAAALTSSNPRLVFIGDSITHFWEANGKPVWDAEFAPYRAVNFGIAGDRTQHVLWRIEESFAGVSPELVVVQIGTNNLTHDRQAGAVPNTPEEIAEGVRAVVQAVRERAPDARMLVIGVFPRADVEPEVAAQVGAVNSLLAETAWDARTDFMDIGPVFLHSDGTLDEATMWDALHLTEEGYRRWADAIRAKVNDALRQ